jgi:hypothetical protein
MAEKETPKTISVGVTEYYETSIFREALEINVEDYPELAGMNYDEIVDYVEQNAWEMKPTNDEYYESLGEELMERDIVRDKITNETQEVYVK